MTYHSSFDYECPKCGTHYAPFKKGIKCPKCGHESEEIYPMAEEALHAWNYHVKLFGYGLPLAYAVLSLGDHYIYLTAVFLTEYFDENPKDEDRFVEDFAKRMKFNGKEYLRPHFKEYFKHVLKLVHEKGVIRGSKNK